MPCKEADRYFTSDRRISKDNKESDGVHILHLLPNDAPCEWTYTSTPPVHLRALWAWNGGYGIIVQHYP